MDTNKYISVLSYLFLLSKSSPFCVLSPVIALAVSITVESVREGVRPLPSFFSADGARAQVQLQTPRLAERTLAPVHMLAVRAPTPVDLLPAAHARHADGQIRMRVQTAVRAAAIFCKSDPMHASVCDLDHQSPRLLLERIENEHLCKFVQLHDLLVAVVEENFEARVHRDRVVQRPLPSLHLGQNRTTVGDCTAEALAHESTHDGLRNSLHGAACGWCLTVLVGVVVVDPDVVVLDVWRMFVLKSVTHVKKNMLKE